MESTHRPGPSTGLELGFNLKTLWFVFMLFVLYGTLMPFNLCIESECVNEQLSRIVWIPFNHPEGIRGSLRDIVQNILFFIPFGFLGFLVHREQGVSRILWVTFLGFCLSFSVETFQLFAADRSSSMEDITTNSMGSFLGALGAYLFVAIFKSALESPQLKQYKDHKLFQLLMMVLAVSVIASLQPFDLTVRLAGIGGDINTLMVNPFAWAGPWKEEGLIFLQSALLAYLSSLWFKSIGYKTLLGWGLLLALLVNVGLELAQVVISSRQAHAHQVLIAIGASFVGSLMVVGYRWPLKWWAFLLALMTFVAVGIESLSPFQWADQYTTIQWFPFWGYYDVPTFLALSDFLETMLKYLPLGFLMAVVWQGRLSPMIWAGVLSGSMALILEASQGWVVGRYPDITDVLGAIAGCCGGYLISCRWWQAGMGEATLKMDREESPRFASSATVKQEAKRKPPANPLAGPW